MKRTAYSHYSCLLLKGSGNQDNNSGAAPWRAIYDMLKVALIMLKAIFMRLRVLSGSEMIVVLLNDTYIISHKDLCFLVHVVPEHLTGRCLHTL